MEKNIEITWKLGIGICSGLEFPNIRGELVWSLLIRNTGFRGLYWILRIFWKLQCRIQGSVLKMRFGVSGIRIHMAFLDSGG